MNARKFIPLDRAYRISYLISCSFHAIAQKAKKGSWRYWNGKLFILYSCYICFGRFVCNYLFFILKFNSSLVKYSRKTTQKMSSANSSPFHCSWSRLANQMWFSISMRILMNAELMTLICAFLVTWRVQVDFYFMWWRGDSLITSCSKSFKD